jgi:hypothetical protein
MSTKKTELKLRPLAMHELDAVNGAGIPVQNPLVIPVTWPLGPVSGPVQFDATVFGVYSIFEPVTSRAGVANWTDHVGRVG